MQELQRILDSIPNRKFRTKNLFEGLLNAEGQDAQDGVSPVSNTYVWIREAIGNMILPATGRRVTYDLRDGSNISIVNGNLVIPIEDINTNQAAQKLFDGVYDVNFVDLTSTLTSWIGNVTVTSDDQGNLTIKGGDIVFDTNTDTNITVLEMAQIWIDEYQGSEDIALNFLTTETEAPLFFPADLNFEDIEIKLYNERDVEFGELDSTAEKISFKQKPIKGVLDDVYSLDTFFEIKFYDTVEQDWNGVSKYYITLFNPIDGKTYKSGLYTLRVLGFSGFNIIGGKNSKPAVAPADIPALLGAMVGRDYRINDIVEEVLTQATENTPDYTKAFELIEALPGREYREEQWFLRAFALQGIE